MNGKPKEINGKVYPMWSQFVEKKHLFIGGTLKDLGDSVSMTLGWAGKTTTIVDIILRPNGEDSAFFYIEGRDFSCGFDVQQGGITSKEGDKYIAFSSFTGHKFRIWGKKK